MSKSETVTNCHGLKILTNQAVTDCNQLKIKRGTNYTLVGIDFNTCLGVSRG